MIKLEQSFNWRLFARNRRFLLYASGIGLLVVILIWQAMVPLVMSIITINQDISKEVKTVAQLQQKANRLQELEGQDTTINQQMVNAVLPSKKPVLQLLTGLNVVAGKSGVSFTDFIVSPGQIATTSAETSALAEAKKKKSAKEVLAYDTLAVQLTAEGTFDQVQTFLKEVEQIAPFTTVTDLNLSIRRRQAGVVKADDFVSAELTLNTDYYTQSLKAALTSPLPVTTTQHDQVLAQLQTFIFPTFEEQQQVVSQGVFDLFGINTSQLLEQINK